MGSSPGPLAVTLPAAWSGLPALCGSVPPGILLRSTLPISGGQHDLELVELIPVGVGPVPLRNRQKLLQAGAGGNGWRFVHGGIISFFDENFEVSVTTDDTVAVPLWAAWLCGKLPRRTLARRAA